MTRGRQGWTLAVEEQEAVKVALEVLGSAGLTGSRAVVALARGADVACSIEVLGDGRANSWILTLLHDGLTFGGVDEIEAAILTTPPPPPRKQ